VKLHLNNIKTSESVIEKEWENLENILKETAQLKFRKNKEMKQTQRKLHIRNG